MVAKSVPKFQLRCYVNLMPKQRSIMFLRNSGRDNKIKFIIIFFLICYCAVITSNLFTFYKFINNSKHYSLIVITFSNYGPLKTMNMPD